MVLGNTLSQRIGSNWRRTDGIRVEKFPRIHYSGNYHWDSKDDGRIKVWTWAVSRKDHLHVKVQWHFLEKTGKSWKLYGEFHEWCSMCQEVPARMLVISGTWLRESGTELMSASHMVNGTKLLKSWCSCLLRAGILYFVPPALYKEENFFLRKKRRRWKEVHSLERKWRNRWINSSHCYFCQSAQNLRSSRRFL